MMARRNLEPCGAPAPFDWFTVTGLQLDRGLTVLCELPKGHAGDHARLVANAGLASDADCWPRSPSTPPAGGPAVTMRRRPRSATRRPAGGQP